MKLIVAVGKDWGIGKDNKLLFSLKEDMKFFKNTTMGNVVIMGKNTYLSLPKRPLPGRVNIVLSSVEFGDGCISVHDMDELKSMASSYNDREVFVIGGASMYRQMLPFCSQAYITKVDLDAEADVFFPNLDMNNSWECVSQRRGETEPITFCIYNNKNVLPLIQSAE